MNFVIFLLNFDEFLSEFYEELQKITDILDILFSQNCQKNSENARNFRIL